MMGDTCSMMGDVDSGGLSEAVTTVCCFLHYAKHALFSAPVSSRLPSIYVHMLVKDRA